MKKNRLTLSKQIAAAKTLAQKWEIALVGGTPETAIQGLPREARSIQYCSPPEDFPKDWKSKVAAQLKQRFADLLFPALMKDDPAPFEELLEAMAKERRERFFVGGTLCWKTKPRSIKREIGRTLRLAIINLSPDDLISMKAVETFLVSEKVDYFDESHLRRVMREQGVHLLKAGDTVYFDFSEIDSKTGKPKKWRTLRKLLVGTKGKATNYGTSRKEYERLSGWKRHRIKSAPPVKADK